MKCRKCGQEIEDGHQMCLNCGSAIDFEEVVDEAEQEEKIEQIIKTKPIQKLSRQMIAGVLLFIIACLFVGITMSYAGKTLSMYSVTPNRQKTTTKSTAETTTEWIPLEPEQITEIPFTGGFQNEYRKFSLRMTGCYAEMSNGIMPKLYITVENTTDDYIVSGFTLRVIAFDKYGKRISKNNTESGKYIDFKYKNQKIEPGKKSELLEITPVGFDKGVTFNVAIMEAQSSDGYKYELKESQLIWKKTTIAGK